MIRKAIVHAMRKCENDFGRLPDAGRISYERGRLASWFMSKVLEPVLGSAKVLQMGFVHAWDWARVHSLFVEFKVEVPILALPYPSL